MCLKCLLLVGLANWERGVSEGERYGSEDALCSGSASSGTSSVSYRLDAMTSGAKARQGT